MSQFPDERGTEMRDLFFETAQDLLQSLNDDALKLEKAPQDTETIRSIRRTVHTLKGDAAVCGFKELSELAHLLEDALAVDVAVVDPARTTAIVTIAHVEHGSCMRQERERDVNADPARESCCLYPGANQDVFAVQSPLGAVDCRPTTHRPQSEYFGADESRS